MTRKYARHLSSGIYRSFFFFFFGFRKIVSSAIETFLDALKINLVSRSQINSIPVFLINPSSTLHRPQINPRLRSSTNKLKQKYINLQVLEFNDVLIVCPLRGVFAAFGLRKPKVNKWSERVCQSLSLYLRSPTLN